MPPRKKKRAVRSQNDCEWPCPPLLLIILLLVFFILALSQVMLVHNTKYIDQQRKMRDWRSIQAELREMDRSMRALLLDKSIPSIDVNRKILQNEVNAHKIAAMIEEASSGLSRGISNVMPNDTVIADAMTIANKSANIQDLGPSGNIDLLNDIKNINTTKENDKFSLFQLLFRGGHFNRTANAAGFRTNFLNNSDENNNSLQPDLNLNHSVTWPQVRHDVKYKHSLEYCPSVPPNLVGATRVDVTHNANLSMNEIVRQNPEVLPGGAWRPRDCVARHRVAVIIPYRDRLEHLIVLLSHLHPVLQRQQLDYRVIVVEQTGNDTFNKARLMNLAFVEGLKMYNFQCFVFHDVDLVPEDDRNMYSCPVMPRHMSVAIDEMGYKLAYEELVGGVLNMRVEHFQRVNGYSNLYWGWGAEDDDMAYRIMHVGLKITRPPTAIARYKMIRHVKRKPVDWRKRTRLLRTGTRRFHMDGLNSLTYNLVSIQQRPLFTHVMADIGKVPKGFS